jgi:hypothetical protein
MMLFVPLRDEATLDFSNVASRRRGHQPCHVPHERLEYPVVHRHTRSGDRRERGEHTMLTKLSLGGSRVFGDPPPLSLPRRLIA